MSAIREYAYYVHYWAGNAVKNTSFTKGEVSNYTLSRVQNKSRQLNSKISWAVKQKYADAISALHNRNNLYDTKLIQETQKGIEEVVDMKFQNSFIDFDTGKVFKLANQGGVSNKRENTSYIQQQNINFMIARIQKIQAQIDKIGTAYQLSQKEIETFLSQTNQLIKLLKQEQATAKTILSKELPSNLFKPKDNNIQYIQTQKELKDLLKIFNQNLQKWGYSTKVATAAQGFSEEVVTLAAAQMAFGIGISNINNALKDALDSPITTALKSSIGGLTGSKGGTYEFYVNNLPAEVASQLLLNNAQTVNIDTPYGKARTSVVNSGAQQKVDVVLQLPEMIDSPVLRPVTASVKNINLSKDFGISLVNGTNLFYLLSDEDPRYLRRVFNILAEHTGNIMTEDGPSNEYNARALFTDLRKEAWLSVKYLSAYKALSGDTFHRQAASLFIVNDNSNQQVYVLEISDIMNLIYKAVMQNNSALDEYFSFELSPKLLFNQWQDTVDQRMVKFIQDVHNRKINVAFRNSAFNKIIKAGVKGKVT